MVMAILLAAIQFGGPALPETASGHRLDCRIALANGSIATLRGSTGAGTRDRSVLRGGGTMYAHIFDAHDIRYRSADASFTPQIVGSQERGAALFLYFSLPDHRNMHVYVERGRVDGSEAAVRIRTQGPDLSGTCRVDPPLAALGPLEDSE